MLVLGNQSLGAFFDSYLGQSSPLNLERRFDYSNMLDLEVYEPMACPIHIPPRAPWHCSSKLLVTNVFLGIRGRRE